MLKQYLPIVFILVSAAVNAQTTSEQQRYLIKSGDLDGDGLTDIYVREVPRILSSIEGVPLFKSTQFSEFVLKNAASGQFAVVSPLTPTQRAATQVWPSSNVIEAKNFDINIDGYSDLLLTNVDQVITAASNAIAFASRKRVAAPVFVRSLDSRVESFIRDVVNRFEDEYYFAAAIPLCSQVSAGYFQFNSELNVYEWHVSNIIYCTYQNLDHFSADAWQFWNSLYPVLAAGNVGELTAGTPEAIGISDTLSDVFGIDFFGGALKMTSASPEGTTCPGPIGPAWEACAKLDRLGELLVSIYEVAVAGWSTSKCPSSGAHVWDLGPGDNAQAICAVGDARCTTANVYKEQLVHPAPGWIDNQIPVQNGQVSTALAQPIVIAVNKPILWHKNTTLDGHPFHPGQVERKTVVSGGKIYIDSTGTGNGECKALNEVIGPILFSQIDALMADHILFGVVDFHEPVPP